MSTTVVAEAGVNHNGSLDLALQLVDAAAQAGADIVKFQTFRASHVASRYAAKADYQKQTTAAAESQLEMIRALELDAAAHRALKARARERNIGFLSTPFDLPSLRLLIDDLDLEAIKLPSGEITNAPFLLACARERRRIILSTGLSTLDEVEAALGVLAFGYINDAGIPASAEVFSKAFASDQGRRALRENVTLLHCTSEYPAPPDTVNLRAMETLERAFGLPVGLSDHSVGIEIAVAAAARGACIVEKHFTLDRAMSGPDHAASLDPAGLASMVAAIRNVERALGDGVKRPAAVELKNLHPIRRSIVASQSIRRGDPFTVENLAIKRPGGGVSPFRYWDLLNCKSDRDYLQDEPIDP